MRASVVLVGAALRAARSRSDVEVVGVVDVTRDPQGPLRLPRALARRIARQVCNPRTVAGRDDPPLSTTLDSLARRHAVPLSRPGERGVNDPGFVARVRDELRPDATLAFMVAQIFRGPLLAACGAPANYHNGLLPAYRGVGATEWGIYDGEPHPGFAFHRMSERVDEGPILLQGSVSVTPGATPAEVERAKTDHAETKVDAMIDLLVQGEPGRPQEGQARVFTRADLTAIRAVGDPRRLDWDELERRTRAFGQIEIELDGECWEVTALRPVGRRVRHPQLVFRTADGVRVEPTRCKHLPPMLYRAYRPLRARLSHA
jgi:methionyl-tRNA formyltransferase